MSALSIGNEIEIPGLKGKWSIWSPAPGPSAYFAVAVGRHTPGYATVKASTEPGTGKPRIELLEAPE